MRQEIAWIWMQQTFGIGTRKAHLLLEQYGDPASLLRASAETLRQDALLTDAERRAVLHPDFAPAQRQLEQAERYGAAVLTPEHPDYPELLQYIHAKPLVLYVQGDTSLLNGHYLIAMVGTRNPDAYGLATAKKLSTEIVSTGGVVVSGLAVGLDAMAHRGALEGGGKTIAFVAAGLDSGYPQRNAVLRELICKHGAVLSEFPFGIAALPHHFPIRNRLISGISLATVVLQAKIKSGTMLTARLAMEQNKDLYAVPGDLFQENMQGCHALLQDGAIPALSGEQIMAEYLARYENIVVPARVRKQPPPVSAEPLRVAMPDPRKPAAPKQTEHRERLPEEQQKILAFLDQGTASIEAMGAALSISAGQLLAALTMLEIQGLVQLLPGRMVSHR